MLFVALEERLRFLTRRPDGIGIDLCVRKVHRGSIGNPSLHEHGVEGHFFRRLGGQGGSDGEHEWDECRHGIERYGTSSSHLEPPKRTAGNPCPARRTTSRSSASARFPTQRASGLHAGTPPVPQEHRASQSPGGLVPSASMSEVARQPPRLDPARGRGHPPAAPKIRLLAPFPDCPPLARPSRSHPARVEKAAPPVASR